MTMLFVTGAGTGVGKTYITALLVRQLRARGIQARAVKPVISGFDEATLDRSDSAILLDAMGELATPEMIATISPWRYAAPLAPNMAARREGKRIDFDAVVSFCRDAAVTAGGPVLVEGVGGAMAPLTDDTTVLDWIAALNAPALLVSGNYLGAISHALTALAALRARGTKVAALVVSESEDGVDLDETLAALRRHAGDVPVLAVVRSAKQIGLDQVADLDTLLR
jgi:dethiobiotin synthetase